MKTLHFSYSQCLASLLGKNCQCAMLTPISEVHMIVSVLQRMHTWMVWVEMQDHVPICSTSATRQ